MSDLTPAALKWLADHHGVITTAQLKTHGVGRKTRLRLRRHRRAPGSSTRACS